MWKKVFFVRGSPKMNTPEYMGSLRPSFWQYRADFVLGDDGLPLQTDSGAFKVLLDLAYDDAETNFRRIVTAAGLTLE